MITQIRLSGSGGQGLILAGILLAKSAIIDKKKVLQSQTYGPESRGGKSRSDVIISNENIYYPRATDLDILLCLTQESADKYIYMLKDDGLLVYDSSNININPIEGNSIGIEFSKLAIKKFKKAIVTNIISLAFICELTKIVSISSFRKVVKENIKEQFVELNLKAVNLGVKLAKDYTQK